MNLKKNNLKKIYGDASFRKFYRKYNKNYNSSVIVIATKEKEKNLLIYTAVNEIINKSGLSAPKLILENYNKDFIEITDFGNESYYNILNKKQFKFNDYKKIINLLTKLQKIKIKKVKNFKNKIYKIPIYSKNLLIEESDLFYKWYLPLIFKKKKVSIIKQKLKKKLDLNLSKLKFKNKIFVHRDFHISNLMKIKKNKIGIIDSQDAVIGNPAYDLVSLVDDVRIKTSTKLKNRIVNYYFKKCSGEYRMKKKIFLSDFNILSIQRNLKILGIFSRLFMRDKKRKYLRLLPYTWKLLDLRMKDNPYLYDYYKYLKKNISKKIRNKKF